MTFEEAKEELIDMNNFRSLMCDVYCKHDYYCPTDCDVLEKANRMNFDRIIRSYARNDGDIVKVYNFIKQANVNTKRGD